MECKENKTYKINSSGCLSVSWKDNYDLDVSYNKIDSDYSVSTNLLPCDGYLSIQRSYNDICVYLSYKQGSVTTQRKHGDIEVSASIVCTVSLGDNGEPMWWCNDWRVLWNEGIPTLWRN